MVIQKDVTERSHHKVIRKSFQRLILTHSYSRNTTYAITLTLLELDVNTPDHRGLELCDRPLASRPRSYAMQDDTTKTRAAYNDFFTMWKDADSDTPS